MKGSYQLATITSVSCVKENSSTMQITFPLGDPLFLQAGDKPTCQEWVHAIGEGESFPFYLCEFVLFIY